MCISREAEPEVVRNSLSNPFDTTYPSSFGMSLKTVTVNVPHIR